MVPLGSVCSEDDDVDENYVSMSAATTEPPVAPRFKNRFLNNFRLSHSPSLNSSSLVPGYPRPLLTLRSRTPTMSQ